MSCDISRTHRRISRTVCGYLPLRGYNNTNERLKRGLDDLACAYPELTQDEYVDEMLRLFKQAGLFLTREELETLLMLRRQTDLLLLRNDKT